MPSLWKKPRGNRITQLVVDLQTPSKRGGSLVVETGFPTSLIDLFVKHRNKLKKNKSKKEKVVNFDEKVCNFEEKFGKFEEKVGNFEETVVKFEEKDGNFGEKIGEFEEKEDNFEEIVVNNDLGKREEIVEGCNSKNMVILLSILMGVVFFVVELYANKWVLALITLGFFLVLLLEYLGIIVNGFCKICENSGLNWGLVDIVALYTKGFVAGVTIGAYLLILLEYTGKNSIFGFFKPCHDAKVKLQAILSHWGCSNKQRRDVLNDGVHDLVSRRDFDQECVSNGAVSSSEIELEDNGEVINLKGESEQESRETSLCNGNSNLIEEVKKVKVKPIYEHLALESIDSKFDGFIDLQGKKVANVGRQEGDKDSKLVSSNGQCKKNKKFWKRLVPKKKTRKIKKHDQNEGEISVVNLDCIQENTTQLEEKERDAQEVCLEGVSTSGSRSSSSSNEESEGGSSCIPEMQQPCAMVNCAMVKKGHVNMNHLAAVVIPLTGLIGGRMLAVLVTVICCIVFKMLTKKLRKTSVIQNNASVVE